MPEVVLIDLRARLKRTARQLGEITDSQVTFRLEEIFEDPRAEIPIMGTARSAVRSAILRSWWRLSLTITPRYAMVARGATRGKHWSFNLHHEDEALIVICNARDWARSRGGKIDGWSWTTDMDPVRWAGKGEPWSGYERMSA